MGNKHGISQVAQEVINMFEKTRFDLQRGKVISQKKGDETADENFLNEPVAPDV